LKREARWLGARLASFMVRSIDRRAKSLKITRGVPFAHGVKAQVAEPARLLNRRIGTRPDLTWTDVQPSMSA